MTIWFSSDTHFGHANILKYCKETRGFLSIQEHDQHLIEQWNKHVQPNDDVYHLGDVAFTQFDITQLNGRIHLIRGNHDKKIDKLIDTKKLVWIKDYYKLKVKDKEIGHTQEIVLCHFPFETWDKKHHGSWHLHGHEHGCLPSADHQARLDVGVDVHNLRPISYEEVKQHMTKKTFKSLGHN